LDEQLFGKIEEFDWSAVDTTTDIVLPEGPVGPEEDGFDEKAYGL
jgi:hypothetical protein